MSITFRRASLFIEAVPFRWSQPVSIERRTEGRGRYFTLDAIFGPARIIASWRR